MADMQTYQPVDRSFFDTTRFSFAVEVELDCSPDQLFTVFEDAHAWTVWADALKKVEWTSPKPYGIGTTRSVHMMGGLVGHEEFVEWEPGKRMAFTFIGASKDATEKFLEDYRVTDLGDGTCRVQWYMAMETRGFSRHLMFLTRPIMRLANRRMFKKFREYTEAHAARQGTAAAA